MKTSIPKIALIRTALGIAILAGISAAIVNVIHVREKIVTLQASLHGQTVARQTAEAGWTQTKAELGGTTTELAETKVALNSARVENSKLTADLTAEKAGANSLKKQLEQTKQQRDEAQLELSRFAGVTPQQILTVTRDMAKLREAVSAEQSKNRILASQVAALTSDLPLDQPVPLPAGLRTSVSITDPKWRFVVLNAGTDQGVLKHGELLISRNGKLVAKARVSRVEKDRSGANLLPGWEFGDVMEGDVALPAVPRS